jgi:hypothetical protein
MNEALLGSSTPPSNALSPDEEASLVRRVIRAYKAAATLKLGAPDPLWLTSFAALKRPIHDAIMLNDVAKLATLLHDPAKTDLHYGFDNLSKTLLEHPTDRSGHEVAIAGELHVLCDALGARRQRNPEWPVDNSSQLDTDTLISRLDAAFGVPIDFPNPFSPEFGLDTRRGVASYRAVQALYQAWRISRMMAGITSPRVVEIGAGLGRTAYYARRLGIVDYTIVDIPMSAVAQANFLGRVLGLDAIHLFGEDGGSGIRIVPPAEFFAGSNRYDLVVNVDSLTEMDRQTAVEYMNQIERRADLFWSVNHEANEFCVRDLFSLTAASHVTRVPYWLRVGYVEELLDLRLPNSWHSTQRRLVKLTLDRVRRKLLDKLFWRSGLPRAQ